MLYPTKVSEIGPKSNGTNLGLLRLVSVQYYDSRSIGSETFEISFRTVWLAEHLRLFEISFSTF